MIALASFVVACLTIFASADGPVQPGFGAGIAEGIGVGESQVAVGTYTFLTSDSAYVAALFYARSAPVAEDLKVNLERLPSRPGEPETPRMLHEPICPVDCIAPPVQDWRETGLSRLSGALDAFLDNLGAIADAKPAVDATLDRGSLLLVKAARAPRGSIDRHPEDVTASNAAFASVLRDVRSACAERRPVDFCNETYVPFSVVVEFDPGWNFSRAGELPRDSHVVGPVAWRALPACVLPPDHVPVAPDPGAGIPGDPCGTLEAVVSLAPGVFLPTFAVGWAVLGWSLSFIVNPLFVAAWHLPVLPRRAPFLPVPAFATLVLLALILLFSLNRNAALDAAGWSAGVFGLFYLAVFLVYTYGTPDPPFRYATASALGAVGMGFFPILGLAMYQALWPAAIIEGLYGSGDSPLGLATTTAARFVIAAFLGVGTVVALVFALPTVFRRLEAAWHVTKHGQHAGSSGAGADAKERAGDTPWYYAVPLRLLPRRSCPACASAAGKLEHPDAIAFRSFLDMRQERRRRRHALRDSGGRGALLREMREWSRGWQRSRVPRWMGAPTRQVLEYGRMQRRHFRYLRQADGHYGLLEELDEYHANSEETVGEAGTRPGRA